MFISGQLSVLVLVLLQWITASWTLESLISDRLLLTPNSRLRPMAAKTFEQLMYVSFPELPFSHIKLETEKIGNAPCEIPFPLMDNVERPVSLESLANGKLVLSLLVAKNRVSLVERHLLSLILDPDKCEYVEVKTLLNGITRTTVSVGLDESILVVLAGKAEFDVFLADHPHCSDENKACRLRYNQTGGFVEATGFERPRDAVSWSMSLVKEMDLLGGYFRSVFRDNGTVVERLNQELKMLYSKSLNRTFLHSDIQGSVSWCRGISRNELECQFADSELRLRSPPALLDTQHYRDYLRHVKLFSLGDGGGALLFLVLQIHTSPELEIAGTFSSYLQRIDGFGPGRLIKFQENVCKNLGEARLIRIRDGFYCLNVSCKDMLQTKCILFDV